MLWNTRQSVTGSGLYVFSGTKRQIKHRTIGGLLEELYDESLSSNLKRPDFIFEPYKTLP